MYGLCKLMWYPCRNVGDSELVVQLLEKPLQVIARCEQTSVESLKCYLLCVFPQILNGPKYQLQLSGSGYKPRLDLSFLQHDFGPCTVWQQGMEPIRAVLKARNDDKQNISFDVLYDLTEHLHVDCGATVLTPGETKSIVITFQPREVLQYADVLPLRVNGLYTINVNIKGKPEKCTSRLP